MIGVCVSRRRLIAHEYQGHWQGSSGNKWLINYAWLVGLNNTVLKNETSWPTNFDWAAWRHITANNDDHAREIIQRNISFNFTGHGKKSYRAWDFIVSKKKAWRCCFFLFFFRVEWSKTGKHVSPHLPPGEPSANTILLKPGLFLPGTSRGIIFNYLLFKAREKVRLFCVTLEKKKKSRAAAGMFLCKKL